MDLYFSGHNHVLEHLRYPGDATDYVVSGSGGSHYRDLDPARIKSSKADSQFQYRDNGFVWIEATDRRIDVQFFDADASCAYQFSKEKP